MARQCLINMIPRNWMVRIVSYNYDSEYFEMKHIKIYITRKVSYKMDPPVFIATGFCFQKKSTKFFRPPELDQPRYRPTRDTTTREERIPNLRDSIQRNSSSSSSSDEDGSSFEDSFEQMMENWADDDPLVLDQTGKLLTSAKQWSMI